MPRRRVRSPGSRYKCQYKGCNNVQKHCAGKRFFCFPNREKKPETFKQWIINTESENILFSVAKNLLHKRVCQDHFKDSSFKDASKMKLRPLAVPEPRARTVSTSCDTPPSGQFLSELSIPAPQSTILTHAGLSGNSSLATTSADDETMEILCYTLAMKENGGVLPQEWVPTIVSRKEKREAGKKEGDPDKKPRKKKIKESNDDEVPRPETSTVRNKLRKRKLNCCAMGCQNTSDSCLMFIIPKDPTLRNRWVLNINRKGWQPNDQSAVCEMHFVSDWWEQDPLGGRSLKPDAVPTEYLTGDAWASGPSTASASGSGHEWTDNNWTETEGDEEMMDIEEHSVFIKQELMEPEVDLKEELDPEAPTEPVPGFETVFVNSTEFKDGDKSDFPPIKVEVEETEENESSDNETEPKVPRYSTVPSYLGSSSPVITSTSVLSCSSAPTVSVVTTFPSSVTTTTVSTVTGLMSTLPSPLMVPVIPNVTQKTAPGGVPAGHKQFIILCPQTVQKTLTTQSSTSSTQTTVAPLTSKQLQEMPKLIKPHGSHKVIGLTPVQASKIISATPIQSSQVRSPTPIQLPQAKNLIPIKLPPAKSLTPAQSSQAKSPTPTQLPQAKSPTPTQLPQPKSLTTTQSCQAESPPSQPTSSPPTQEAPPPSNQTNQEPQLVDNCYVETENSIKIDLSALPQALKAGIKEKVKYLLDAIFLKHINPKDIVIAFRQSKGAQFAILSA